MKLTYLNKTVEINIPSTTKRLKQQVLEDFFDSYKDADIPAYENEEFLFELGSFEGSSDIEEIPVNAIGQWMSGGADSYLLAYLLCKKYVMRNWILNFNLYLFAEAERTILYMLET